MEKNNGSNSNTVASITERVTTLLEKAAGEQMVSRTVNPEGNAVEKVDLNGLQTVVKILKTVTEIRKEISERGDDDEGGVVVLPHAAETN